MSHQVIFLQSALDDLQEIRRFVRSHFSHAVWLDASSKIRRGIMHLEQFPFSGHVPRELPSMHFQEIVVAKNRVIYEVVGQSVFIHIICDSRQDFKTMLTRRPVRSLLPPLP